MSNPLVECIPNFSDARRPEVIDAILDSIGSVPGVHVLDRHSDLDHNRTVITMVGHPTAVEEAAFLSIKKASELINLEEHTGAHPRIGATDVVPFVPITDIKMADCIEIAQRLGKRVGDELAIPVYLYEEAATRTDRQNLENIRKGQYEGLKEEILTSIDRMPDFGPAKLGPAGATVIGARAPLIAYNIYLNTNDLAIAQKIAKALRNSSGGFHFVKAMGVLVDGRAQVSMNLTNYRQTPVARVVETIRREAARYGVGVHHSELVGLIPQEALVDAAIWYTQMDGFKPSQILENRLFEVLQSSGKSEPASASSFLDELASGNPTPGGGSAAAYTGAAAAALVAMVGRVTVGKKKYADVQNEMVELVAQAEDLRTSLTAAVQEDAKSFEGFILATRLPKETPAEQEVRSKAINDATITAAKVPFETGKLCMAVSELALKAASLGNINAVSDAASACYLAKAALASAAANVKININSLTNPSELQSLVDGTNALLIRSAEHEAQLQIILADRASIR
jgi:glutamate formiminotransferase / formiminotetrahydrofolate cyclodeaminase